MVKLSASSRIYVLCPANVETGGPESLHNLVRMLSLLGHCARIVYEPSLDAITPQRFVRYRAPYARTQDIVDAQQNLLVVPEIWTDKLDGYQQIQKAVWWLSVDEHFRYTRFDFHDPRHAGVTHFAQSHYVEHFLHANGASSVCPLNSSLNPRYYGRVRTVGRADRVLYNPVKGQDFISRLKDAAPQLCWTPITGMKPRAIMRLMRESKVYVDFGHFPGRDRLPREAALCGCCVIIGNLGSAAYYKDFSIPARYRFDLKGRFQPDKVVAQVRDCLDHFEDRQDDFAYFRRQLTEERKRFIQETKAIFGRGTFGGVVSNHALRLGLGCYLAYKLYIKRPLKRLLTARALS